MLFSAPGQAILLAHERHSRLTIAVPQNSLKADPVADAIVQLLQPMPASLRRSITFDNGTEFTRHHRIERQLAIQAFFCDPHAPWQKGGIENAIGRDRKSVVSGKSVSVRLDRGGRRILKKKKKTKS